MTYIKEFLALFILVTLLLYLVPGEGLKKYIRFFTEIVLMVGILSPLLALFFDDEKFLRMIEYETFTENLSEIARDMERMEFVQNDYYLAEYENAIEEDARQMVEPIAENYGYEVNAVKVHLTEAYRLEDITLSLGQEGKNTIVIEEITWAEHKEMDYARDGAYGMAAEMRRKLAEYYQLEEKCIAVQYEEAG